MVAILPAAGKGTRMRAFTDGRAKELLAVGGKPVIEWTLDEAMRTGVDRIIVVVSPDKPELEQLLRDRAQIVTQEQPEGHGAAVTLMAVNDSILILNPDTIFFPHSPLGRLRKSLEGGLDIALAVEQVPEERVSRYGVVEWDEADGRIGRILEKPEVFQTYSRWAIAGRFGLSAAAFAFVRKRTREFKGSGEIGLTSVLAEAIDEGFVGGAFPIGADEQRLDCGDPAGFKRAVETCGGGVVS